MGSYTVNVSIKPVYFVYLKNRNLFSVLSYIWIFLKVLKPFDTIRLVIIISYIAVIRYIPQIHQIALTNDMCQENGWEALLLQLLFHIFWMAKKDIIP